MTIPNVDNTTLNNLTPNLDIGDVADPALRLAAFQYIYAEMQTIVTDLNASQAAGTITTLKLADGSVVTAKLADGAVTGAKMADGTIVTIKLADGSITTAKIVAGAVGTTQLADLAVTQAKIANGAVGVNQLATGLAATVDVNAQFMKRALDVTSAPFSAKGDGVTDDSAAVNAAIDYANANGYTHVFLPSVHMIKGIIYLKSNITLYGNGECSELLFNEPIYRIVLDGVENVTLRDFKTSRFGYKPILIKNGSSNIRIQNIQFVSSYSDYCISTCISLETCSKITIDGCYFYRTGYQVLQEAGYVSNNVIVQNCISERCFQDFVELNSESSAISRNWIIRNNRVYDIGMYQTTDETTTFGYKVYHWTNTQITAPNVEGRFFGMTWCDNVLIEGNIVEGVGGDSAFHIEQPMNVVIINNTVKNAHSTLGRFVYSLMSGDLPADNTLQSYNVPKGEQKLTLKDNTFILDSGVTLTGDTNIYVVLIGRNRSISTAFTDFGTNNNFIIEGNKFFYYNPMPSSAPYTTGYPRIPTTKYGIGVELTFCYSNVYMEKNTFQGLEYGLVLLPSRKDANVFGSFIDKNKFNSCQTAVYIDEHAVWSFQNNSFTNCGTALTYTNKVYSFLQNVTGNHFYNTPVTGLNIVNATQKKNKYISSTTDDFTNEVVYPSATTTITLGTLPKSLEQQFRGLLIVSAKGNVTSTDPYTTAIYNISYFYTGTSFIGRLSLINQDASSVRVTNIVPSLDLTNGLLKATITTTENYQISCAIVGY